MHSAHPSSSRWACAGLDWKTTSWPGVRLAFLDTGSDGSARVLIAMEPGAAYPAHRHRGPEEVFVLAGAYQDETGEYAAGSRQCFPAGSAHRPVAGAAGALLWAWAQGGVELPVDAPAGAG